MAGTSAVLLSLPLLAALCCMLPECEARGFRFRSRGGGGGFCDPSPCLNGATCEEFDRYHRCTGCDKARFGTGRDCEPVENDVGPWGAWSPCKSYGRQIRRRACLKPRYFFSRGVFECTLSLSQTRSCVNTPVEPQPPVVRDASTPVVDTETEAVPTVATQEPAAQPDFGGPVVAQDQTTPEAETEPPTQPRPATPRKPVSRPRQPRPSSETRTAGPWGSWERCNQAGIQYRRRRCLKPVFFYSRGFYTCGGTRLAEVRFCPA